MFMLVWGPTVAAVSVVLDHADNPVIVSTALEGLMHAARIAAYHHIDEVLHRCWQYLTGPTVSPTPGRPNKHAEDSVCEAGVRILRA